MISNESVDTLDTLSINSSVREFASSGSVVSFRVACGMALAIIYHKYNQDHNHKDTLLHYKILKYPLVYHSN